MYDQFMTLEASKQTLAHVEISWENRSVKKIPILIIDNWGTLQTQLWIWRCITLDIISTVIISDEVTVSHPKSTDKAIGKKNIQQRNTKTNDTYSVPLRDRKRCLIDRNEATFSCFDYRNKIATKSASKQAVSTGITLDKMSWHETEFTLNILLLVKVTAILRSFYKRIFHLCIWLVWISCT